MWDYGMHGASWGWGLWLLMIVGTVAFWVVIAWFVRSLIQDRPRKESRAATSGGEALQILDQRLARGEVEPEEYERIRSILTHRRP